MAHESVAEPEIPPFDNLDDLFSLESSSRPQAETSAEIQNGHNVSGLPGQILDWPSTLPYNTEPFGTFDFNMNQAVSESLEEPLLVDDWLRGSADAENIAQQSDNSWTSEDNLEDWQFTFEDKLAEFLMNRDRVSFITDPLPSRQRKQVHAMAHLRRLGHMSLGCAKLKVVLIAKTALHAVATNRRYWTPGRSQLACGVIDPRIITLCVSWKYGATHLQACAEFLAESGFAPPQALAITPGNTSTASHVRAFYSDPCEAAFVVRSLQTRDMRFNSSFYLDQCDYTIFESCTWGRGEPVEQLASVPSIPLSTKVDLPPGHDIRKLPSDQAQSRATTAFAVNPSSPLHSNEQTLQDPMALLPKFDPVLKRSRASRSNSGYASCESTGSRCSLMPSDHGSEASGSQRKRQRHMEGAYSCSYNCGKVFDFAGDRTKHERIHQSDRPYHCAECGHGFMYPKDLRRHGRRRGHKTGDGDLPDDGRCPVDSDML